MRKLTLTVLLIMILCGCSDNDKSELAGELMKAGKNFSYTTVEQGLYEEKFYYVSSKGKVFLEFDIINIFTDGEWNPVKSIQLLDRTGENVIHIKYVPTEEELISILIKFQEKTYFEDDFVLKNPSRTMTVTWNEREVQIRAGGFEYALSIPFDVELLGSLVSSMEVITQIRIE